MLLGQLVKFTSEIVRLTTRRKESNHLSRIIVGNFKETGQFDHPMPNPSAISCAFQGILISRIFYHYLLIDVATILLEVLQ